MIRFNEKENSNGFTLIEIIVSTGIFVIVVSSILVLFTMVLRINREVQVSRKATQGVRNFTEVLTREIRNGQISYQNTGTGCLVSNYASSSNQALALVTTTGDQICIYLSGDQLFMEKITNLGTSNESINSSGLKINNGNFAFIVRPVTDPKVQVSGSYPGIQPMVTIIAEFSVTEGNEQTIIPYQTTISTDVYDIPHQ